MCPPEDQDRNEQPEDDGEENDQQPSSEGRPSEDALSVIRNIIDKQVEEKLEPVRDAIRQLDQNVNTLAASMPTAEQVADAIRRSGSDGQARQETSDGYPPRPEDQAEEQPAGRLSLRSREAREELLIQSISRFLEDPFGQMAKAREAFTGIRPIDPSKADLGTIKAIASARPDEFAFVANSVMPDPMMEYMPQESAKAYRMGFEAAAKSLGRKMPSWWNEDEQTGSGADVQDPPSTSTPFDSQSPQPVEYAAATRRRSPGRLSRALAG